MLIRTTVDGVPASASLTDRALTISRNDEFVAAWDPGGRLYSVVDGETTYRRGLNGRMLIKWRQNGERQHAFASQAQADGIVDRAAAFAAALARSPEVSGDTRGALSGVAMFDSRAANADARRFRDVYHPIGILPPDQYLALVLQATEGCSFRSCTFCDFYRQEYRVKSATLFAEHVGRVRDYLGASVRLRERTVFLGSANALAVPMPGLVPLFDLLVDQFPGRPVYAFLDGFTGVRKTAADYRDLALRGLRRVYIGLESGHDPLLAFVRKPSTREQVLGTVRAIKDAGVNVGIMVMVGLGGDRFADAHVADTAEALNEIPLGNGDLLYFSELVDLRGSPYLSAAAEAGIRALSAGERKAQRRAIEDRLHFTVSRPRIATYDVREFIY
jgi:radical SAM superfamily enzyme YgiQ (UPF0313 family)